MDQAPSARTIPNGCFEDDLPGSKKLAVDADPVNTQDQKIERIQSACHNNDLEALVELATSCGGLVHDRIRRTAWPILLGVSGTAADDSETPWTALPPYHDEEQVQKDVDRSFVNYPPTRSDKDLHRLREELSSVILSVLRRHPFLRYFQGYHDIVQVLLLVLGTDAAVASVRRLSLFRIRDFMVGSDVSAAEPQLRLIPSILCSADHELFTHLRPTNPFYALASTLTLYAHTIEEYGDIARLFDFFLAQDATAPLYLFAAIILQRRSELLQLDPVEDADIVTFTIQKLPPDLDLEALIAQAQALKESHPPERLPLRAWRNVSQYSVLKTTRKLEETRTMTLLEGEMLFAKQAAEVRRQQAWAYMRRRALRSLWRARSSLWKNRRPALLVALTFSVGLLALWLGRKEHGQLPSKVPLLKMAQRFGDRLMDLVPRWVL